MKRLSDKRRVKLEQENGGRPVYSTIAPKSPCSASPLKTRGPVKPRNDARRKREFLRAYGSVERVEFVRSLACAGHVVLLGETFLPRGGCHNAHTVTGGAGRKANADTIAPLRPRWRV